MMLIFKIADSILKKNKKKNVFNKKIRQMIHMKCRAIIMFWKNNIYFKLVADDMLKKSHFFRENKA